MKKQIEQVKEFHKTFNVPIKEVPQIIQERAELRMALLREEVDELEEAIRENDIVGASDAVIDCLYILFGTAHEFGISEKLEQMFDEVHRSNMSKLDENGNVVLKPNGKVGKSNIYSPPNLKSILENGD